MKILTQVASKVMKNIEPCEEVCHECGFLNDSQVGVLKESLGLKEIIEKGVLFPCHLQLKAVTGSENTGVEIYAEEKETFKVCRGLVESSFISGLHLDNPIWIDLYEKLNAKFDSKTMTINETIKYHKGA